MRRLLAAVLARLAPARAAVARPMDEPEEYPDYLRWQR